ncbi:MAG TPA: CCC motif membrane protein [Agriterribacter sp.]|nr:CCC motif membrane protein [Agriterribacter sp.]
MVTQETSIFAPQSQRSLPNASAVLALGIISIIGCCCYGFPGIICAIVALILYSKDAGLYQLNPEWYTASSYSNLRTGRICAIIGLVPSILFLLFWIFIMITAGFGMLSNPRQIFDSI